MKLIPSLSVLLVALLGPATYAETTADLDVKLTSPPVAGFPLIFDLKITNTSSPADKPPSFWGAPYPSANDFEARITDAAGHVLYRKLQNEVPRMGTGGIGPIERSLTFPGVADGLTAGDYTLFVLTTGFGGLPPMRSPAVKLAIREDAAAFKKAAEPYSAAWTNGGSESPPVDRIPVTFSEFVGATYGFAPNVRQWLTNLGKPDAAAVRTAAIRLASVHRLPDGGVAILKQALARIKKAPLTEYSTMEQGRIVESLMQCAANQPGEEGANLLLAETRENGSARFSAVEALADCPPGKTVDEALLALTKDPDRAIARTAMMALGAHGNPIALTYVKDEDAQQTDRRLYSSTATRILRGLPDNAEACQIIRNAYNDSLSPLRNTVPELLTRINLIQQGPATRP